MTETRDEWLAARMSLLQRERAATHERDAISQARRDLPRLRITKDYGFVGPDGPLRFVDLFEGRSQLLTYHFMWPLPGYGWCPVCSLWIDNVSNLAHLHARDTTFAIVCTAPQDMVAPYKERMGWQDIPWYTSATTDFSEDFAIDFEGEREQPGVSAFLREGEEVFYSYSTYRRGSDILNNTYNYLDLTPLGRQEEELAHPMLWVRHHDQYEHAESH